jgi:hypothetical protein
VRPIGHCLCERFPRVNGPRSVALLLPNIAEVQVRGRRAESMSIASERRAAALRLAACAGGAADLVGEERQNLLVLRAVPQSSFAIVLATRSASAHCCCSSYSFCRLTSA